MFLPKGSVETWVAPFRDGRTLPVNIAARVSFDDGETWHDAERPDENSVTLLIAHPDADQPGNAVVIEADVELVTVEFVDGVNTPHRPAGNIILG
jgi:hypothetical protein